MRLSLACILSLLDVFSANALEIDMPIRWWETNIPAFCLQSAGFKNGSRIVVRACRVHETRNQQWIWNDSGELVTYDNTGNSLPIDVPGGDARPGKYVQLWTCNATSAQKFQFQDNGQVRLGNSNLCLDVPGDRRYSGAPVQLWTCNYSLAQKWTLY